MSLSEDLAFLFGYINFTLVLLMIHSVIHSVRRSFITLCSDLKIICKNSFLFKEPLQFSRLVHSSQNIRSTQKFTFHKDLGNCWPFAVLFDSFPQFFIFQDIDSGIGFDTNCIQNVNDVLAESTLWLGCCARTLFFLMISCRKESISCS